MKRRTEKLAFVSSGTPDAETARAEEIPVEGFVALARALEAANIKA